VKTQISQPVTWLTHKLALSTPNVLTLIALVVLTALTDWRLIDSGLPNHLFDFGPESLNAVQAWENHGFWSMAGMFSWGQGYLPADLPPEKLYQSKTPLHLLHLWLAYKLFGSAGFASFKLVFSLAVISLNGLLLGWIAVLCFHNKHTSRFPIPRQLIFVSAYAITISNESMLRFCLMDEPDYLALTSWLATVVNLALWVRQRLHCNVQTQKPAMAMTFGFLTSWLYPILGVINFISLFVLQLFPLKDRLRQGLRWLMPGALLGIGLYWLQRIIAKLLIPEKLYGSKLMDRMGLTGSLQAHDGVLDAINFLYDQRSGGIAGHLKESQIYIENIAVWILGILLFFIVLAKASDRFTKVILILAAAEAWLFVALLSQSLSQHGWVYGVHFVPSVVLGWIGGLSGVLPGHRSKLFGPGMLGFIALLIWVIQLRWFMVAYLT
jgi:hypothetical protein